MLVWRLTLGALLIAALVGLFVADSRVEPAGALVAVVALLLAWTATGEALALVAERHLEPSRGATLAGVTLVLLAGAAPLARAPRSEPGDLTWLLLALGVATAMAWAAEMIRYREPGPSTVRAALAVLAAASIGVPLALLIRLRLAGPQAAWGALGIASMLVVVKLADIGAYSVGRLVGRHKMAPRLSPGKTWEGAVGAILFGCLGAWLSRVVLGPVLTGASVEQPLAPRWDWLAYGLSLTLVGMAGDLAESLLKRDMNRKDSSRWMPGFGGVLDLIDSVLAVAPVAFGWWVYGWIHP